MNRFNSNFTIKQKIKYKIKDEIRHDMYFLNLGIGYDAYNNYKKIYLNYVKNDYQFEIIKSIDFNLTIFLLTNSSIKHPDDLINRFNIKFKLMIMIPIILVSLRHQLRDRHIFFSNWKLLFKVKINFRKLL